MFAISSDEVRRLVALLARHRLQGAENLILAHARPCVTLVLDRIVERDERPTMDDLALGASRFGGPPDLPADVEWPCTPEEPMSFLMQLDLAALPAVPNNPLPARGMLWVFHGNNDSADDIQACVMWRDVTAADLRRRPPKSENADGFFFREYEPLAIRSVLGADVPPVSQHDLDLLESIQSTVGDSDDLVERFFSFAQCARDPSFDERAAAGYPYHYMIVDSPTPWMVFEPLFVGNAV
jgi:Domain of unknown function (DUF1963)